ncbi:hypothetical protein [Luteipulveratus halotolerans]|uniref:hypothetical protein n=1 Tax=Luteipulveratus halotolerans TaxID=1631356 RepID=UPI00067FA8D2|nr:hypothetical protein [Luteipulveratus halotolerans]
MNDEANQRPEEGGTTGHPLPGARRAPGGARRLPGPTEPHGHTSATPHQGQRLPHPPPQQPPYAGPPQPPQGPPQSDSSGPSTYGHQFGGRSFGESWREEEFGHGQDRYYGPEVPGPAQGSPVQYGAPPSGPSGTPKRGGRRTALIAAGAVAAVAVLGGGGYALSQGLGDDRAGQQTSPTSSAPATPTSQPSTASPATSSGSSSGGGLGGGDGTPPLVPGWRVKKDTDKQGNTTAVDFPLTDWQLKEGQQLGYGDNDGKPVITAHEASTYRRGYCPKDPSDYLAFAAFQTSGDRDPADIAPDVIVTWADAAALKKDGSHEKFGPPVSKQVAINGGRTQAIRSRITVPNTDSADPKECSAPKREIVAQSFTNGNATATVIVVRELGVPNALDDKTLDQILASARPVS